MRFELQGEIVKANDPVLLRHQHTCTYLAVDNKAKYNNDFGTEFEAHCQNYSTNNRSQNLEMEFQGRLTSDVPTKFQLDYNVFYLQTAPEKNLDRPIEELSKFDIQQLLNDLNQRIFELKDDPISALTRIFNDMDVKGEEKVEIDDFRWGLIDFGIQITKDEANELVKYFNKDQSSLINYKEFLSYLESQAPAKNEDKPEGQE